MTKEIKKQKQHLKKIILPMRWKDEKKINFFLEKMVERSALVWEKKNGDFSFEFFDSVSLFQ